MAKRTARPVRDAHQFLELQPLASFATSQSYDFEREKPSVSLLRQNTPRDSNYAFTSETLELLQKELEHEGVDTRLAHRIIPVLLSRPTFAVEGKCTSGTFVCHAAVFEKNSTEGLTFDLVVRADFKLGDNGGANTQNPSPQVSAYRVSVFLTDIEDDDELGLLVQLYLDWQREFPAPARSSRTLLTGAIFLGSPRALGCVGTPNSWREDIQDALQHFGLSARFENGPDVGHRVGKNIQQVFRFEPYRGSTPKYDSDRDVKTEDLPARSKSYESLFRSIIVAVATFEPAEDPAPTATRELLPQERVYHRKVDNGRKFDKFDAGSPNPCTHGEGAFVSWGGDKALKGMERRYSNFNPSWFRHCSKFPNCNVYGVHAA